MNTDYLLLNKKPIQVINKLFLHQHTMEEIEDNVGYDNYQQVIIAGTREIYEYKYQFENMGIDYKTLTYFSMFYNFCMGEELIDYKGIKITKNERTLNVLNFIFNVEFKLMFCEELNKNNSIDNLVFYEPNSNDYINSDNFKNLKNVFAKMLFIKKPKERFAANDMAKKLIIREMELRNKDFIDNDIYSIISSLLWSPNCKETHESIWNLTPYQIYNGYLTVEKIKNFDNTMSGYYHGTIDKKDFKIENIHWTNKII